MWRICYIILIGQLQRLLIFEDIDFNPKFRRLNERIPIRPTIALLSFTIYSKEGFFFIELKSINVQTEPVAYFKISGEYANFAFVLGCLAYTCSIPR